jgi:DNA repair exonuclease SbcCD ATPase subunit
MIPVRVHLRDFLCYGHGADGGAVTFDFEGSRLWSISGDNGAGKSAIFDAIRYALYGEHRDGSQRDARLIRRGAQSCDIMFEFRSDGKLYRVRRTVGRARGKSLIEPKTWQAALYDETEEAWRPIPGSDRKDGLDTWVQERLRLSYGTFIASVLLLQGESDRLTRAASKERFEILSGLLALEEYERLAGKARDCGRVHRSQADQLDARLLVQAVVRGEDLEAAVHAAAQAEQELDAAQSDVAQAATILVAAKTYEQLTAELAKLAASLTQLDALLATAPRIREEYAEWSSLSERLPRLRQAQVAVHEAAAKDREAAATSRQVTDIDLVALRKSVDAANGAAELASTAVEQLNTSLENNSAALEALRANLDTLQQHEASTQRFGTITKELSALRTKLAGLPALELACEEGRTLREALPQIKAMRAAAKRVSDLTKQLSTLRKQLTELSRLEAACAEGRTFRQALPEIRLIRTAAKRVTDLGNHLSTLRKQLTELAGVQEACVEGRALREALPLIRQIRECQLAVATRQEEMERIGAVASWQSKITALEKAVVKGNANCEDSERERGELSRALARAEQQHDSACDELKVRENAEDEAVCSRCGQRVSPEHIKLELSHARARVARAGSVMRDAKTAATAAGKAAVTATVELEGFKEELAQAKSRLTQAQACAKERTVSEAKLSAAQRDAAGVSVGAKRVLRSATQEQPTVTIDAIERKVSGLSELERQLEALRKVEGNARAVETQLSEETAILESLVGKRDASSKTPSASQRVVRDATLEQPTVTVETIERTVSALPELEQQLELLRKLEGNARAVETQLAQERTALESLVATRDDSGKTLLAVQRLVREATLDKPTLAVEAIEQKVGLLPNIERQIGELRKVEGNARAVEAQVAEERLTLEKLEQQLPLSEHQRVRAERIRLEKEREAARLARARAQDALRARQEEAKHARETQETSKARRSELESAAREASRSAMLLRDQAQLRLEDVAPEVRYAILRGDETVVKLSERRLAALAHAESAHQQLAEAADRRLALASRVEATSEQIRNTPAEHRVSLARAREQQAEAADRLTAAQRRRDDAREALRELHASAALRRDLETQRASSRRHGDLYGQLADLLGRTGLQAVLMDEALAGIGELANETLNRISGGQLRLVMERETTGRGDEIKIRSVDLGSSDDPLDVAFLSGSQKFRVAVALAAGIGQYSAGANRIRALIIDEGFGSLDDQGRQEMVDELRTLSAVLDRVIVVSHQEDFQDRTLFPTGYVLRKSNQQTEVIRFV